MHDPVADTVLLRRTDARSTSLLALTRGQWEAFCAAIVTGRFRLPTPVG